MVGDVGDGLDLDEAPHAVLRLGESTVRACLVVASVMRALTLDQRTSLRSSANRCDAIMDIWSRSFRRSTTPRPSTSVTDRDHLPTQLGAGRIRSLSARPTSGYSVLPCTSMPWALLHGSGGIAKAALH